jgi:hypothetical protein
MNFRTCRWCGENPENVGATIDDESWTHDCLDGFVTSPIEFIDMDIDLNDDDEF